ncbi:MAG: RidA family protein [Pseudomonadota bacterium]
MTLFHKVAAAPQPVGPFCHATESDGWVFLTGQMPTCPEDPAARLPEGIAAQTKRVIDNLSIVLDGIGLSLTDVVQCRCYLTEFERDFDAFNTVYRSYFADDRLPARTTIGVTALAVGALVEIDMVARRPNNG